MTTTTTKGWKTSEFLFALAMLVAGVYLIQIDRETEGSILLSAAVAGYTISRGLAKSG
jgi:hypothetical protein